MNFHLSPEQVKHFKVFCAKAIHDQVQAQVEPTPASLVFEFDLMEQRWVATAVAGTARQLLGQVCFTE